MARRANKGGLRPPRGLGGAEPPGSEWNAAKRVVGAATERRRELARCRAPPERRSGAMTPHAGTAQTFLRGASARRERRGRDCGRCRRAVLRGGLRAEAIEVAAGRADGAGLAGGGRRDVGPTRRRQTRVASLPPIRECRRHRAGCFSVGGVARAASPRRAPMARGRKPTERSRLRLRRKAAYFSLGAAFTPIHPNCGAGPITSEWTIPTILHPWRRHFHARVPSCVQRPSYAIPGS